MTEEESQAFWPIYNDYQKRDAKIERSTPRFDRGLRGELPNMTGAKAQSQMEEAMAIETDGLALKNSHMPKFARALPAKKLVRYYQVENKLKAIIDYDLASATPLVK